VGYLIDIFPRARADIQSTVAWLSQRSPWAAARRHAGLLASIRTLSKNPERCALADEAEELSLALRELLYGRRRDIFCILFTIEEQTVNVLRVRHAAQDRLRPGDV
jgi:plasmid stabilization system protein ParE